MAKLTQEAYADVVSFYEMLHLNWFSRDGRQRNWKVGDNFGLNSLLDIGPLTHKYRFRRRSMLHESI